MDWDLLGSSNHRISQARILEWIATSFSKGSSQPRDWNCIGKFFTTEPPGKPQYSLEGLMLIPVLGPPDAKNQLTGKDLVDGKDWRQKDRGLQGICIWANSRDSRGQRSLDCCSPSGLGLSWIPRLNGIVSNSTDYRLRLVKFRSWHWYFNCCLT